MNKKAKVLLITPNLKGIADGVNRIQPSLGLMLIAPILEKNGHEVKIYDAALDGWEKSEYQNRADQIGIWTGTSWSIYHCNLANEWEPEDITISSGQSFFVLRTNSVAVSGGFKKLKIPHYEPRKGSYYTYDP